MAIFDVMLALTFPSLRSGARWASMPAFSLSCVPAGNVARDGASGLAARGLSDPALENQWQSYAPNMDLMKTRSLDRIPEGFYIRPTEWCQEAGPLNRRERSRAAPRDHVAIASCPPGLSARRISLTAANRSGKNCRPCWHTTKSKAAFSTPKGAAGDSM